MIAHKPKILYFDNHQSEKIRLFEGQLRRMGIDLVTVRPEHLHQTVGYLAKIKGFPPRKLSVIEPAPFVGEEIMVLCNFSNEKLDELLASMKNKILPQVSLKAVLTSQNCFWTFAQLYEELTEEREHLKSTL